MTHAISTDINGAAIYEPHVEVVDENSDELGQDVFLKLMVTQLQNQNPLDPQDNSEFVAQLAQFSTVEGIDGLNNSMSDMASSFQSSQALQASAMVGRFVKVDTDTAYLGEDGIVLGTIDLPVSSDDLKMVIYDSADQRVADIDMGLTEAGEVDFYWDGLAEDGTQLEPGEYRFEAFATVDGAPEQLNIALSANVDSVSISGSGVVTLNVAGVGEVSLSSVREIL